MGDTRWGDVLMFAVLQGVPLFVLWLLWRRPSGTVVAAPATGAPAHVREDDVASEAVADVIPMARFAEPDHGGTRVLSHR